MQNSASTPWYISLLGTPTATRNGESAHLRSKSSWILLSSLLVPQNGPEFDPPEFPISRAELISLVWSRSADPGHALRQALTGLRQAFGSESIHSDRRLVQACAGLFITDVALIAQSISRADRLPTDQVHGRMELLLKASKLIRGELLSGCVDVGSEAYLSLVEPRSRVSVLLKTCLTKLSRCQRDIGDLDAAFETTRRLQLIDPEDQKVKDDLWQLGKQIRRPLMTEIIRTDNPFEEIVGRAGRRQKSGTRLSRREQFAFDAALADRLSHLSIASRKHLLDLSILTAPANSSFIQSVCGVGSQALHELTDKKLIEKEHDQYHLIEVVRTHCRTKLSVGRGNRIARNRLTACTKWLSADAFKLESPASRYFTCLADALPHITASIKWQEENPISQDTVEFQTSLRVSNAPYLALELSTSVERQLAAFHGPSRLAVNAARSNAWAYAAMERYADAVRWYEIALGRLSEGELPYDLLELLCEAYHRNGQYDLALDLSKRAEKHQYLIGGKKGAANCVRFRSEIFLAQGRLDDAILCLLKAERKYHALPDSQLGIANCRYWMAEVYMRMEQYAEAEASILQALEIRLLEEDITGEAQCLITLGQLRGITSSPTEGLAHVRSAARLLLSKNDRSSHAAALIAIAEILGKSGRITEAIENCEQALAHWKSQNHAKWTDKIERRLHGLRLLASQQNEIPKIG